MKYEIIKFKDDKFELDVNVSPKEDTVWLTQEQIASLFDRERSVINRHINNVLNEECIDLKRNVRFLHTANSDKRVKFYNLDVIISVGYRVKSKRGILFRRWANSILKDYLIKGYAISSRAIVTKDNYISLTNKVLSLDKDVHNIKEEIKHIKPNSSIFYNGQYFTSHAFIKEIIKECNKKIIIIDPYMDINVFDYLINLTDKSIICIYLSKAKITNNDFNIFKKQYIDIKNIINDDIHDRFIILDDKKIYHIGTSLNYLGHKTFIITKIIDEVWIDDFIKRINCL